MLKDHAPFMSTLRPGVVVVTDAGGTQQRLFVRGGFADVSPRGLTILAEQAVPVEDVSDDVVAAEIKHAETEFANAGDDEAVASRRRSWPSSSSCATLIFART